MTKPTPEASEFGDFLSTNVTESSGQLTQADFNCMLEKIYADGATPDIVYPVPECAYEHGIINLWELRWLQLKRSVGRLTRVTAQVLRRLIERIR